MHKEGDQVHIDDTEASGGSKEGVVRYVLVIGLFLAIAALTLIWVTGALTQGEAEEDIAASSDVRAEQADDGTDSIVSDGADEIDGAPEPSAEPIAAEPEGN